MRRHLFTLMVLISGMASAQNPVKSPYSRFGVGLLNYNSTASSFALGGTYSAYADSNVLNYGNPASYTFIARQRPIFDVGIGGNQTSLRTSTQSSTVGGSGLRNIALGLPISKRMGAVMALAPFSYHGYEIVNTIQDDNDNDIDFLYNGDGGLTRLFGGFSYAPLLNDSSKLSIGFNVAYTFGNLSKERWILFDDATYRNTKVSSNIQVRGMLIDAGIQYHGKISKKLNYKFGATYALSSDLSAVRNSLATTFVYDAGGVERSIDTTEIIDNSDGFIRMPQMLSAGLQFELKVGNAEKDKKIGLLTMAAQYKMEEWGSYLELFGDDTTSVNLQRSNTLSLGFEYLPLISLAGDPKYINLIRYRAGFRFNPTYITIGEQAINNYGISFGVGLPLINTRSTSSLNLSFEYGQRGTTDNMLIEERYFQFMIGLSMSPTGFNRWFVKRKYD